MKDTIPVVIMTVIALVMILDFFIGDNAALAWIGDTAVVTRSWGIVIQRLPWDSAPLTFCGDIPDQY